MFHKYLVSNYNQSILTLFPKTRNISDDAKIAYGYGALVGMAFGAVAVLWPQYINRQLQSQKPKLDFDRIVADAAAAYNAKTA